jgi:excisionase family DNA binding protein
MVSVIRGAVNYGVKADDGDALFKASELTTREAAELAGCSLERVRQLVEEHNIGRWVERLQCYAIDRGKLMDHLARKKGRRPLA